MTNMTKDEPAPEPETAQDEPEACADCGHVHPEVGTRRWFWQLRITHLLLWVAPLLPLGSAVWGIIQPRVLADTPKGLPDSVARIIVDVDAAWWERPLLVLPTLAMAACFGIMAYAMWRVEVNLAGNHQPFTEKDMQWMRRAMRWEIYCFLVAAAGIAFVVMLLPCADGLKNATVMPGTTDSFVILGMGILFGQVMRLYTLAKKFYDRQKDIV